MHLESLLSQYRDIKLDHCPVVKEYIHSGRGTEIGQQVEKCDGEKSTDAQQKFQVGKDSSLTFC